MTYLFTNQSFEVRVEQHGCRSSTCSCYGLPLAAVASDWLLCSVAVLYGADQDCLHTGQRPLKGVLTGRILALAPAMIVAILTSKPDRSEAVVVVW